MEMTGWLCRWWKRWGCSSGAVVQLANRIYDTGHIPTPMQLSIFVAIPKKPGVMDCNKHRTISVMSQLGKTVLRIFLMGSEIRSDQKSPKSSMGL